MKPTKHMKRILFLCVIALAAFGLTQSAYAASETLSDDDCVKCHINAVKDVAAHGAAHNEMGCQDCHLEHAPLGAEIIPECALCHAPEDSSHYKISNCVGCHYPHHPLQIDFSALTDVKPACISCHDDKGTEMTNHPSAHSEQDCNECHTAHGLDEGQFLNCLDCHEAHSDKMTIADCTKCHKPHSPVEVTYAEIPSSLCTGCHDDIVDTLAKSQKAHGEMACSECHVEAHMTITACNDCHGEPHGVMHKKFPNCVDCHIDPHALAE